ncbi:MAG: hypothetical protein KJO07_12360, partial [Deltaproteobacteria bacterium]|nr:hypothetical protein [Deltaproteobacteria bacterium]
IDSENRLSLKTGAPQLWVDVLSQRDGVAGPNPFERDEIEVLASFVAARFASVADDLVGQIPIPTVAGTTIEEAQLAPDRGYMVIGGELSIPE